MPRRKSADSTAAAPSESKPKRAAAPKSAAAPHKHKSKKATETPIEVAPTQTRVAHEDIARLAYSYWEARGYQNGSPDEDWLRAERELLVLAQNR